MSMSVDTASLHKILKDQTRRTILQCLSSNGATSYLKLMKEAGVTNTGRFNYHLKTLSDLITKDADGKYVLTEKGKLAIQLLDQFPIKPNLTERSKLFSAQKPKLPKKTMALAITVLLLGISALIILPLIITSVQTPALQWQQFLPGISGNAVIQTSDGGYLALGINAAVTNTTSGPTYTNLTPILVKTDSAGNPVWQRTFQVTGLFPLVQDALQTNDGGYALIVSGYSPQNQPLGLLIKTDSNGHMQWISNFTFYVSLSPFFSGLADAGNLNSFVQTSDGGYAIVGTYYVGGGPSVPSVYYVKTGSAGNLLLNKTISGGDAISILPTSDKGYAVVCEFPERGGGSKYGLIKIDADGNVAWSKEYIESGSVSSYADCGIATVDGYLIGGYTINNNQNFGWLVKTDLEGNAVWNITYPNTMDITSISPSSDGFVLLATNSNTDSNFYSNTQTTTQLLNIDSQGNVRSQLSINMGHYQTHPTALMQTKDGGYVFVGAWNESYQATVDQKFWIAKVASVSTLPSSAPVFADLAVIATVAVAEAIIALRYIQSKSKKT